MSLDQLTCSVLWWLVLYPVPEVQLGTTPNQFFGSSLMTSFGGIHQRGPSILYRQAAREEEVRVVVVVVLRRAARRQGGAQGMERLWWG